MLIFDRFLNSAVKHTPLIQAMEDEVSYLESRKEQSRTGELEDQLQQLDAEYAAEQAKLKRLEDAIVQLDIEQADLEAELPDMITIQLKEARELNAAFLRNENRWVEVETDTDEGLKGRAENSPFR